MEVLSYTQKYFLCASKLSRTLDGGFFICLIAGGIAELLDHNYIALTDNNKLIADKNWDNSLDYLQSLYETIISTAKPLSASEIANQYVSGLDAKYLSDYYSSIGTSLVKSGYAEETVSKSLTKTQTVYQTEDETVTKIMDEVYKTLVEGNKLNSRELLLTALFDVGGLINAYFGKSEKKNIKDHLLQAKSSSEYVFVRNIADYYNGGITAAMFVPT